MGLLEKLWDDTLAGPRPETGLGRLRKYGSIPAVRSPPLCIDVGAGDHDGGVMVSKSITILRSKSNGPDFSSSSESGCSTPTSPADSLGSPATPVTPREGMKRLMRRKSMPTQRAEPRNPTVYDWWGCDKRSGSMITGEGMTI
ncbi:hypothetical protein Sjap_011960 [Stephania japonica]|uniref:Uncharacterized protein n=1 Tax=Stephania japonica TaxID=461633 RepID=A0AAP0JCI0_9MAGN